MIADLLDATEERLTNQLSDLASRISEGLEDAPIAVLRPDMHPLAAQGLGIEPGRLLDRDAINALLAGRRADGETIEGNTTRANGGCRLIRRPGKSG